MNGGTPTLVKYDAACRAIAEACTVDEAKDLRDKAEAFRVYARQAKNRALEIDAAEIRLRAERRLGEMLAEQKATVGLASGGDAMKARFRPGTEVRPTLADAGIDKKLSSRAQKLANMPISQFESELAKWREASKDHVAPGLFRQAKQASNTADAPVGPGTCTVADLETLVREGHRFGTIYGDPPWLYDNQGTRAATGNHYDGLTVEQLCALPVRQLAADDAHLHLWTTNAFLFDCPKLFEAWGFEFRSSFVWIKPEMGIGNYWRNSHEILLTAIRGNAKRFSDKSLKSWIECSRGRHSEKPQRVRNFIERASPGPRLELFGRAPADGWAVWGNQIERSVLNSQVKAVA